MKIKKIIYTFIVALFLSQAGSWTSVSAEVIAGQYDNSAHGTDTSYSITQGLGNGFTDRVRTISVFARNSYGLYGGTPTTIYKLALGECTSSSYTTCTTVASSSPQTFGNNWDIRKFDIDYQMLTAKYYMITVAPDVTSLNQAQFAGVTTGTYPFGACGAGGGGFCRGLADIYFVLDDSASGSTSGGSGSGGGGSPAINTSYINTVLPAVNQNNASTNVAFSADYYWNSTAVYPGTDVTQIIAQITRVDVAGAPVYFSFPIVANTVTHVSSSTTLVSGGRYSIGWGFATSSGTWRLIVDPYQFGVVSSTGLPPLIPDPPSSGYEPDPLDCDTFDIACYLKSAFVWLFYPSQDSLSQWTTLSLRYKFPFSYLYDIGTAYNELFANGGSAEYLVQVNTGALGTVTFISASQINAVPFASTIKTILGYLLWFMTGMFLYRLLHKAHD